MARNEYEENEHLQFDEIDSQSLLNNMNDTTSTLFCSKSYIDLTLDEIKEIQKD